MQSFGVALQTALRGVQRWPDHAPSRFEMPTFDSAAGMGQIPLIPGFIPYLILMVAGFDSAAGPIPVKGKHWRGHKNGQVGAAPLA